MSPKRHSPTEWLLKIQNGSMDAPTPSDETHCTVTTYPFCGCLIGQTPVNNVYSDGRNKAVIAEGQCLMQLLDNSGLHQKGQARALLNLVLSRPARDRPNSETSLLQVKTTFLYQHSVVTGGHTSSTPNRRTKTRH